jgi:hypothetical protein
MIPRQPTPQGRRLSGWKRPAVAPSGAWPGVRALPAASAAPDADSDRYE